MHNALNQPKIINKKNRKINILFVITQLLLIGYQRTAQTVSAQTIQHMYG